MAGKSWGCKAECGGGASERVGKGGINASADSENKGEEAGITALAKATGTGKHDPNTVHYRCHWHNSVGMTH